MFSNDLVHQLIETIPPLYSDNKVWMALKFLHPLSQV